MIDKNNRIPILSEDDIIKMDCNFINDYDFSNTPNNLRPKVMGKYLGWSYHSKAKQVYEETQEDISHKVFAEKYLKVNQMNYSGYKNGTRMPTGENLENLVSELGFIIYDIVGVPRKMPNDKDFEKLLGVWLSIDESQKKDLLKLANNFLLKK